LLPGGLLLTAVQLKGDHHEKNATRRRILSVRLLQCVAGAYLYTFNYDALNNYAADSIVFSSATLAINVGDVLSYVSGDINGCAPTSLTLDGINAFATPIFGNGSCGDGIGPDVDGLFFRPDVMPPMTTGIFVSTDSAGRQFQTDNGNFYNYVDGSLVITDDGTVPEPVSLQLVGLAAVLAVYVSRRRRPAR
jgi:hypothetical protein